LFWLTMLGAVRAAAGTGEGGAQLPPVTPGSSGRSLVDKVLSELEAPGGRVAARRPVPRRAPRPRAVRRRVLRQRPHGRRVPDGRDAGPAAAGGPAPAVAHLRAGPGERRARRPAHRS